MLLPLPDEVERDLTPGDAALYLALGLYLGDRITLGQGATIARVSHTDFLHELGKRRIPIHYGEADVQADIDSVEHFRG